jgi:hypothetical protein
MSKFVEFASNYILYIILAIVLVAGFLAYKSYKSFSAFEERIEERFVKPYMELVQTGKEAEAYQRFTTKEFREKYPLNVYLESYRRIRAEKGNLTDFGFKIAEQSKNVVDGTETLKINVGCTFEHNSKKYYLTMQFSLAEQSDGGYVVRDSFSWKNLDSFHGPW